MLLQSELGLGVKKKNLEEVPSFVGDRFGVLSFAFVKVKTHVVDKGVG
jgi:hypothetical protein